MSGRATSATPCESSPRPEVAATRQNTLFGILGVVVIHLSSLAYGPPWMGSSDASPAELHLDEVVFPAIGHLLEVANNFEPTGLIHLDAPQIK